MWELVLCWFGACNEFLGIGYFCVGVSVSQNRHIAIFWLLFQNGAGNCKKGYSSNLIFVTGGQEIKICYSCGV